MNSKGLLTADERGLTQIKDGWKIKKLSEVCEKITDGTHQTPKYFNEGIIFLSSKNVTSGKIDWKNIKFIDKKQHLEMHKRVSPQVDDILLAKNGTTGVAAIVDKDVIFDIYVSLALLRPLKELLPTYLLLFVNSPLAKIQFNKRLKGSGVPNLHLEEIREVEIPLPPLPEQKRIVAKLDEAFTALAKVKENAEKNLANARKLFESYLQGVFLSTCSGTKEGWEVKKLGEVGKISMCKRVLKKQTSSVGDIPFYKIGTFGKTPDAYISKELYNEFRSKFSFPKKGDILISASGTIGRRVIYDGSPSYFQDSNIVWINNDEKIILNKYLYHYYRVAKWKTSKGTTISRLYNYIIEEEVIYYPSILQQKKIIEELDELKIETRRLEFIYQQKISDLDVLKKSILVKAFKGDL